MVHTVPTSASLSERPPSTLFSTKYDPEIFQGLRCPSVGSGSITYFSCTKSNISRYFCVMFFAPVRPHDNCVSRIHHHRRLEADPGILYNKRWVVDLLHHPPSPFCSFSDLSFSTLFSIEIHILSRMRRSVDLFIILVHTYDLFFLILRFLTFT